MVAIALIAMSVILFLLNTHQGIGILPDSTRYMGMNDQPYDAPIYAWLVQGMGATPLGLFTGAKLIALLLVITNSALVWHILARCTNNLFATAIGTALVLLSPQFVSLHAMAMSEPLFLSFILLSLLALLEYWRTQSLAWLAGCGMLVALCTLTRFTGVPLGMAVAATLLLLPHHRFGARIREVIVFGAVAALIFFAWLIASQIFAGHSLGRELRFLGNMGAADWLSSVVAMGAWLLPDDAPLALRVALLAMCLLASTLLVIDYARRTLRRGRTGILVEANLPLAMALFVLFYMGFMVLSTSLEANLSLNGRYAFPAYVAIVMLLTIIVAERDPTNSMSRVKYAFIGLAILLVCCHTVRTSARTMRAYHNGIGYMSREWTGSPTLRIVRAFPATATIWSNGPDAVFAVTQRRTRTLPHHVQLRTGLPNKAFPFDRQIDGMRGDLARSNGYVVFLDGVTWRFYLAPEAELVRRLNLKLVAKRKDGRIYTLASSSLREKAL